VGGPGQGKTALVQEFMRRALESETNLAAARGNCQAYFGSGDPFLPFREILEMLTGQVERRWEAGTISHDHARRMWHLTVPSTQALVQQGSGLIGTFISGNELLNRVSFIIRDEPAWLDNLSKIVEQTNENQPITKEALIQQYCRVLKVIAHRVPLLIFVDDLQWADQSSLNLFFALARQISAANILLLGALRPHENLTGKGESSLHLPKLVNELQLQHGDILIDLDKIKDRQFIDAYLDQDPNRLGDDFREKLFEYTSSHPLYTVEMLFDLRQRGCLVRDEAGNWITSASLNWDHIPSQIEAAIKERLSRLPSAMMELLKTASVEGEGFTVEILADIRDINEDQILTQVREELDHRFRLVQADSSQRIDGNRLTRYRFRHILFQKYLYNQLDVAERVELHEKVGRSMEKRYAGNLEEMSVQLAIHFEIAGIQEKAIAFYTQAAKRANRFSSYEESIQHYKRALLLLKTENQEKNRDQQELDLLVQLSAPLMLARGYASEDVRVNIDRVAALLKRIPMNMALFPIFHAIGSYYQVRGKHEKALDLMHQAELLAKKSEDQLLIRIVDWGLGFTNLWLGKLEDALFHLNQMYLFYDPNVQHGFRQSYGTDAGVASRIWSAWALWLLGYPEQALSRGQEAINLSNEIGDTANQQLALLIVLGLRLLIGEMNGIQDQLPLLKASLTKLPSPIHCADFDFFEGYYKVIQKDFKAGITQMAHGIQAFQACGIRSQVSMRLAVLAKSYLENNQREQAASAIRLAEQNIEEVNEHYYHAEVLRVKGLIALSIGNNKEAEGYFCDAIHLANQQKAKTLELRATMSLASLWGSMKKRKKAIHVLEGMINRFTEGFEIHDLSEACALLNTLRKQ